jgi:ABC-type branched-subunit amino acid transport system permease subunit
VIGAIAGFLIAGTDQQVTPKFGLWATLKGLIAMMLGGLGSMPGAILGGLLLGVVEIQSLWYLGTDYRDLVAYLLLFLVLVLRPGGLTGTVAEASDREAAAASSDMDDFTISVVSNIGMISFLALSAYLLLLTGEISFGQQAYFAIGAYASGIATAMWGWPLALAMAWAVAIGAAAGALVALPTVRLRGLYFSIATLAFAEMVRHAFLIFTYRREVDGYEVGPQGAEGFGDIRYIYENDITAMEYMVIIYALLAAVLALFVLMESARLGRTLRMVGDDPVLAEMQGINVTACKVLAAAMAAASRGSAAASMPI